MKFDMTRAWNDAMALLGSNREVVLVVSGVFFFLPYLAVMLVLPDAAQELEYVIAQNPEDPQVVWEAMLGFYASYWWIFVLLGFLQAAGSIALLALLTDRARPTVGEALRTGAIGLLPYIGVQILQALVLALLLGVPLGIGLLLGAPAIGVLLMPVGLVAMIYVMVKFSLSLPCIAIDKIMNPVTVLARSWRLTKGNSLRLFGFYCLLVLVAFVASMLIGIVAGVLGLIDGTIGIVLSGIINAGLNMVVVLVMLAVLAAIHAQFSGPSSAAMQETFE